MTGFNSAREILRGKAADSAGGAAVTSCRPDAVALAGAEALALLERVAPGRTAFDVDATFLFAGDCRGGGSRFSRVKKLAEAFSLQLIPPHAGCVLQVLAERGVVGAGSLVARLGPAEGRACGCGALVWNMDVGAATRLAETGRLEVAGVDVYRVQCDGVLAAGVDGVDVGLYAASQFGPGGGAGAVLEFTGPVTAALDAGGREGLVNAATLCGPRATLLAPRASDEAAAFFRYDFSPLKPQYAAAAGGFAVADLASAGGLFVSRVVLGPGALAADIAVAAILLKGKHVHSDVELWVAPASRGEHFAAMSRGHIADLIAAGASIMPACALPWADELTQGGPTAATGVCAFEVCAAAGVEVYYVNPAAAAAAALAGELCEPGPLCKGAL